MDMSAGFNGMEFIPKLAAGYIVGLLFDATVTELMTRMEDAGEPREKRENVEPFLLHEWLPGHTRTITFHASLLVQEYNQAMINGHGVRCITMLVQAAQNLADWLTPLVAAHIPGPWAKNLKGEAKQ